MHKFFLVRFGAIWCDLVLNFRARPFRNASEPASVDWELVIENWSLAMEFRLPNRSMAFEMALPERQLDPV
jgi:hypothetical protein